MIRSQKATYRRAICKRLERILVNEFTNPTLITLQCSSASGVPQALAKKIFRSWKDQAQRVAGSPFKFIKVIDFGPHPIPGITFYVIVDLSEELCREVCGTWYMGKATAAPLNERGLEKIERSIMLQDSREAGARAHLWSYCQRSPHSSATQLAQ